MSIESSNDEQPNTGDELPAAVAPTFLDDATTPLPVPYNACRYHLSEPCDMRSWMGSDDALEATKVDKP